MLYKYIKNFFILFFLLGNSVFATTYYVDATNGSNTDSGTSESNAWKTAKYAFSQSFASGDTVLFKRGEVYQTSSSQLTWNNNSGTESNPILVDAYGSGVKPILTSIAVQTLNWVNQGNNVWKASVPKEPERILRDGIELLGSYMYPDEMDGIQYHWYWKSGYLYIKMPDSPANHTIKFSTQSNAFKHLSEDYVHYSNIDFQGGTSYCIYVLGSSYVTFSHCNIGKYANKGIQLSGNAGSDHCTIEYCDVNSHYEFDYSNAGTREATSRRGAPEGILMQGPTSYCTARYNTVKNWTHANINLTAAGGSVHHNKIHNNLSTAPDLAYGGRLVLDKSSCYDNEVYNNVFQDVAVSNQFNGHNNHFHHNLVNRLSKTPLKSGGGKGIVLQGYASEVYGNIIENNVFANIDKDAILLSANNATGKDLHDIIIRNNIMYNNGIINSGQSLTINSATLSGYNDAYNITIENNDIFSTITNQTIKYYGLSMDINTLNNQSRSSSNITADPLFISSTDFSLQSSSPAAGMGLSGARVGIAPAAVEPAVEPTAGPFTMQQDGLF